MRTVEQVMTQQVLSVGPDAPFKQIVNVLVGQGVHALPVVDERGDLLGVVSESDLTCHEEAGASLARLLTGGRTARSHARKARARTARELMSSPARTVSPSAKVCDALEVMNKAHVGRLPVVDGGRLVGIVTRTDLLRVFARGDDELQVEVEAAVSAALPSGADVHVAVGDGIAYLRGHVELTSQAVAADEAARGVPGVVDVEDDLVADVDDLEVLSVGYVGA